MADADALALLYPGQVADHTGPLILTPHEGELARLAETYTIEAPDKLARTRALARATDAVIVAKGPDTVIAAPDGRIVLAPFAKLVARDRRHRRCARRGSRGRAWPRQGTRS